jgi:hypothetical protein
MWYDHSAAMETRDERAPSRAAKPEAILVTPDAILAAIRKHRGHERYLWQQLATAGIAFDTPERQRAILAVVHQLIAQGKVRQGGITPNEPLSLWSVIIPTGR